MITIDIVLATVPGLQRPALERWIAFAWVRADRLEGQYAFQEIDVARIRLIHLLSHELDVREAAMPIVLSLLDQLHEARRRLGELGEVIGETAPAAIQAEMMRALTRRQAGSDAIP